MGIIYKMFGAWILYSIKNNLGIWNKLGGPRLNLDKSLIKKLEIK